MLNLRTQSFCRYRIQGELPSPWGEDFHRLLTERRFLPLMADQERTYGWVTSDNLLVTDFHAGTVMRGEWAAFGLRVDTRRVNARLLRAQIDLEVQARLKGMQDAGDKPRIGRDERKELREDLRKELMRQTSPSVDVFTVLVHPKQRVLHVLTLAQRANDLVRTHFADTFESDLLPLTPWSRSLEILDSEARAGNDLRAGLQDLRRTDFGRAVPAESETTSRDGTRVEVQS
ncbi:MAG: recombination-associated protein RdgC [Planctomycetota bacterium]|nr:recombination-associated protein RdgC [Planctomycetota bacterium]